MEFRGYSKLRIHTVLGPYGRSIRTFLNAVRVLTIEYKCFSKVRTRNAPRVGLCS